MPHMTILKVDDPSCLWGRFPQSLGMDTNAEMTEVYNRLSSQMNLFYNNVTQDQSKLKPTSIEKGEVYVVFWSVMKSWCRAVLESVILDSESQKARCKLVDYGEHLIIDFDQIRVAAEDFLQLPFWVRRFHLARIKPTTLRVFVVGKKAELIPTTHWDTSATLYIHNLLQVSTCTEAWLLQSESDSHSTSIELYLTVGNIKICVNDDLVAKKFAYYTREPAESNRLDEVDKVPVMLAPSILTQSTSATTHKPKEEAQPLAGCQTSDGDCKDRSITEEQLSPGSESGCNSPPADTVSDSPDNTVSSLGADLTRDLCVFKFLKYFNPNGIYQQAAPVVDEREELIDCQPKEMTAVSGTCATQEDCYINSEPAEAEETGKSETAQACAQLLEWLDPQAMNPDPKAGDDQVVSSDPRMSGILVHSAFPVVPCTSLDDAPITEDLRRLLRRKQYTTLSPADCYSWPAVSRGCHTLIVSRSVEQPLSYLTPLLTYILLNSVHRFNTSSTGPIAVLLCPGWEKAQQVYVLLEEMKITQVLHPFVLLVGVGKDEAKTVRIPKNCLLLVTTPFSLVRLLSCYCFMFLRLYHLVLDEADQLFALAPDQMSSILEHFQKATANEEKVSCPQQLVAVAKHWTSNMEGLLTKYMPYPSIIMTISEEAALYGDVLQVILMTLESGKISELLGTLNVSPDGRQKTLIVANTPQEVEDVFKAVNNTSAFCLKIHEGLTDQFHFVIQQWRNNIGRGTHVILVTTNECLKCFGIRDATCVVHYGFPTSPKLFGSRLDCMSDNFRNLSERIATQDPSNSSSPAARSVLLFSEKNTRHIVGILRYLGRTNALLPPDLLAFSQGIHVVREKLKTNKPLCSNVKSFGFCRESSTCPDRHQFMSLLDHSNLPASGVIEVVPLHIKTASTFCGRIVRKEENSFKDLASEMASYYNDHKPGAVDFKEGGLYAVQEEDFFHRVKILSVPDKGDSLFFRVSVRFVDVGKEEDVKSHQILQLPERFHSLPCQAVEIIVCRVKPIDEELNWHPKVTRAISQKIRGLQHRARAVLSLGNTVFVDPMVRVSQVPGMKTVINEYNVHSEILNTGMGVGNPEHLKLLRALCQEDEATSGREASQTCGLEDNSLEVEIRAEEEALADILRAAMDRKFSDRPHVKLCEELSPEPPVTLSPVPAPLAPETDLVPMTQLEAQSHNSDLMSNGWIRNGDGERTSPSISPAASLNCLNGGLLAGEDGCKNQQIAINMNGTDNSDSTKGFHPQVCWYQTSNSVIVTVKLMNPECQSCDFHPDRVVYSGRVNNRSYRADLELHGNIVVDQCCWETKCNKPVLKLVKQQKGHWQKLLRNKNIFVSYDMEHLEEDEDKTPNGRWIMESADQDNWYTRSESGSESD